MSGLTTGSLPDLADLDLLDDASRHATCDICYPNQAKACEPFTAWCGRRAVWSHPSSGQASKEIPPPNACDDCLTSPRCAICGHDGSSGDE